MRFSFEGGSYLMSYPSRSDLIRGQILFGGGSYLNKTGIRKFALKYLRATPSQDSKPKRGRGDVLRGWRKFHYLVKTFDGKLQMTKQKYLSIHEAKC